MFGAEGNHAERISIKDVLKPLLASPLFWLICIMNFSLTLVRETFNFWTPTFLNEVVKFDIGEAAIGSMLFPLVGGCSTLLAGVTSDRLRGRHGRVVLPSLILLVLSLGLLATIDVAGKPVMALTLLSLVAFFLMAPYSFLSGVMAIDLGGKRGCSHSSRTRRLRRLSGRDFIRSYRRHDCPVLWLENGLWWPGRHLLYGDYRRYRVLADSGTRLESGASTLIGTQNGGL